MFRRGLKQALAAAEAENERLRGDNAALNSRRDELDGLSRTLNDAADSGVRTA